MRLGYIGLGKMGLNMVEHLLEQKHELVVFDEDRKVMQQIAWGGVKTATSIWDVVTSLEQPRLIWLMVPHQVVDSVIDDLLPILKEDDVIIDGGNSFYKNSMANAERLEAAGIHFLDVGTSGGPDGARNGACLMIGGKENIFKKFEPLFKDIAAPDAYGYMGPAGAGHFVKMVHNGIEYGMMQAIGEGFEIMKTSPFDLNLSRIADVYNHRSVIESRLTEWLVQAYAKHGAELTDISGSVKQSGEGLWTVNTAKEFGVAASIIEGAVEFRKQSEGNPSYTGKILSALRTTFGGHEVSKDKK
jgi:6-phosphogluconate dehydrogenase